MLLPHVGILPDRKDSYARHGTSLLKSSLHSLRVYVQ